MASLLHTTVNETENHNMYGTINEVSVERNDEISKPTPLSSSSEVSSEHSDELSLKKRFRLNPRVVSDAVLGLSDGMTVPFALTAGLSELGDTRVVVLAGLAELVAGAISMGLGGYLGAKSEIDIYNETLSRTRREVHSYPQPVLSNRVASTFARYQLPASLLRDLSNYLAASSWLPDFLMRFEHGVEEPADARAVTCALTIATGYFVGGFIPLLPYLLVSDRKDVNKALFASVITMIVTLFLLGYGKSSLISASGDCDFLDDDDEFGNDGRKGRSFGSIMKGVKGGLQMLVVGGISAACAVILVRTFNSFV